MLSDMDLEHGGYKVTYIPEASEAVLPGPQIIQYMVPYAASAISVAPQI